MNSRELLQVVIDRLPDDALDKVLASAEAALRKLPLNELVAYATLVKKPALTPDDDNRFPFQHPRAYGRVAADVVLEVLSTRKNGMSTKEIAALCGVSVPTAYRGMSDLQERKFVIRGGNAHSSRWYRIQKAGQTKEKP